jgi:hypothetical protein
MKFPFSTDASNKSNVKLFLVSIQYFNENEGITNFVLDFYEINSETAQSIYETLKAVFIKYDLKYDNVMAYGADNAALNYGKHNSVFMNIKQQNSNKSKL